MNSHSAQSKEPTLKTVVSLIKQLGGSVDKMNNRLGGVEEKLGAVAETVEFLKENVLMKDEAATKQELAAVKDEIVEFKSDVISHIDHFVQLHRKQEVELVALAHRVTRHEESFHKKN